MTTMTLPSLQAALKTHFGFDSFRPHQEEIITALLEGRDVFSALPTGGGKSLCFQLPALMKGGLTLVVSPLIALMKDQVDSLQTNGLPATFINSSLAGSEINKRLQGLRGGSYRLLYLAPERLMAEGFIETLKGYNVQLIAIDEAHCISEWGHDFRPEYRQLARLREEFPEVPILAVTATATDRVRGDIVNQLNLRKPKQVIASFNRPNLTYRVFPKYKGFNQLLSFLKDRPDESGIVYCLARKTCEELAEELEQEGISAKPYHAGLEAAERTANQDLFLRDEVRVMCATIAFGMGVHKSNVRFVVHYNLPRNIEGYYQETGRAGRDGLPADCLLLYSSSDAIKLSRFIEEKSNEKERDIARRQLKEIMVYAEGANCRRETLLNYFGETWGQVPCGGCDNCLAPRESFDATLPAQKLLSCVYRIKEKSGFSVGLGHTVDVLLGKQTEKVARWRHENLSTFGIGDEYRKNQWLGLGQELVRKEYLSLEGDTFKTLHLTPRGWEALKSRKRIELTKPLSSLKPQRRTKTDQDRGYDQNLFDRLRGLRKSLADNRQVPAYIIFSDATLREIARVCPKTLHQFSQISGVGAKKLDEFGPLFIEQIRSWTSPQLSGK